MSQRFEEHLAALLERLRAQREELEAAVRELGESDLSRARRGGWSIARVLEHIVSSELHYAALVGRLRGSEIAPAEAPRIDDLASVKDVLERSRGTLLAAIEGVSEDDFYRLATGREEYSVVSVLENVEQHDIEHLGQLRQIQAEAAM